MEPEVNILSKLLTQAKYLKKVKLEQLEMREMTQEGSQTHTDCVFI
jgi:hypothetical protein